MGYGQYSERGLGDTLRKPRPSGLKQRKFVFGSHSQTAHVWAQQDAETWEGRSGDGRIRFDGPTIYSYGSHFPIAHFTNAKHDGRTVVLFNSDSYSVSTGKHKSIVRGALSGLGHYVLDLHDLKKIYQFASQGDLKKVFHSLLVSWGMAAQHADHSNPHGERWYEARFTEAGEDVRAFRSVFGKQFQPPRNVRTWYKALIDKEREDARLKARAKAIDTAKEYRALNVETIPLPDLATASTWELDEAARKVARDRLTLYRTRRELNKAGRFARLSRECSRIMKLEDAALKAIASARPEAQFREHRESDLATLKAVAAAFAEGDTSPRELWTTELAGRLWSVALREGRSDLAAEIGAYIQRKQFLYEVPETFKRYSPEPRVTPEEWQAGKGSASALPYEAGTLLRRKGDKLQTSRGAEVPWEHAVKAFQFAQVIHHKGTHGYRANGHTLHVGHFTVSEIKPDGTLIAGCHTIAYAEIERLAVREAPKLVKPRFPLPVPLELAA
jgi:hypothetical protein